MKSYIYVVETSADGVMNATASRVMAYADMFEYFCLAPGGAEARAIATETNAEFRRLVNDEKQKSGVIKAQDPFEETDCWVRIYFYEQ
jgi:hypothetical protein